MSWFEVFIPAKDADAMNVTLTVEAPNWIGALRTGLSNIGEGHDAISNVMCDIKEDNSIHVTNPPPNRVFRFKAVPPPAAAPPAPAAPAPEPAPAPAAAAPEPQAPPAKAKTGSVPASAAKTPAPPPKRTTGQFTEAPKPAKRKETKPQLTDPQLAPKNLGKEIDINEVIATVFDATADLMMDESPNPTKIAEKMLEIAMNTIEAESGTFYLADVNGHELTFAAVAGPKAAQLKKSNMTVPVGQGIVGFAAQEGVCLVIQDMKNDSRYFSAVADKIGYAPENTLCASAEKEGRLFGAVQLINAKAGGFSAGEMEVVRYIGLSAADMLERAFEMNTEIGL